MLLITLTHSAWGQCFAPPSTIKVSGPLAVVVSDFTGDGKNDLAMGNANASSISILPGNGDGSFGTTITIKTSGISLNQLLVGDFNGDGRPDLMAGLLDRLSTSSRFVLLLNKGNGEFGPETNISGGNSVVGDFNGDGNLDIATDTYFAITVQLGNGKGEFITKYDAYVKKSDLGFNSIALGEFNGDGRPDLVKIEVKSGIGWILLGDDGGKFGATSSDLIRLDLNQLPLSVVSGDFNQDGRIDIATVGNLQSNTISVLLNLGNGTFSSPTNLALEKSPTSVNVNDFNGDGKLDIASTSNSNTVSVLLGNGNGSFGTAVNLTTNNGINSMASGDFNGDDKLDLVTAGNTVSVFLNCTAFVNTAPVSITNVNQVSTISQPFSYTPNAFIDYQTPTKLTYSANINPANGLSFDATTRLISGTPTSTGVSNVTITAVDPGGLSAATSFSITITTRTPPQPTINGNQNATVGTTFSYTVNAFTDTEASSSISYSAKIIPPNGLLFNPATRIISGTPVNAEQSSVNIIATNSIGLSSSTSFTITASCSHPDYAALVDFYNATNGPNWPSGSNWLKNCNPCTWDGVTCTDKGRVSQLRLDNNPLVGTLPASLGTLTNLQTLILSDNQLSGSIPASLGMLTNLLHLDLSNNLFTDSIPSSFGSLKSIQSIQLNNNKLSGSIPASLTTLPYLQSLIASNNQLSGSIPTNLGALPALSTLILYSNQLSGCLPASLSALCRNTVDLSNNSGLLGGGDFAAFCANSIGSCTPINTPPRPTTNTDQIATVGIAFSYTVNAFTDAETPNSLSYSASITPANGLIFDATTRVISGTPISGGVSSVTITAIGPDRLSAKTSFIISVCTGSNAESAALLDLYNATNGPNWKSKTNWLTGCNPCGWSGVTCTNGRVTGLNLYDNNLRGSIPTSLSALTNLQDLNMSVNQLGGNIPASLGTLSNLINLVLNNNQLSGSIPESFSGLTNTSAIHLENNQLSGSIPTSLSAVLKLSYLSIRNNQLSGSLPTSLSSLTKLQSVDLSNNRLTGSIPDSYSVLTNLELINLSNNQLSGSIPASFGVLLTDYWTYIHWGVKSD
ncbi:FG-GAP-like repeat-containing protein [Spirosoma endophyticum]|uniref:FG-GAP-like repeat-containing protein n=1 Tax=Spirosoma endophyticum TaxID=662367 RepID=UPI0015A58A1B|nr:FG-GAP-like repeat-containing protein [Spirosoma endophyticum]